jgi:hypothetical protein
MMKDSHTILRMIVRRFGKNYSSFLNKIRPKFIKNENLNENEVKLGQALYDLFDNYENIFVGVTIIINSTKI